MLYFFKIVITSAITATVLGKVIDIIKDQFQFKRFTKFEALSLAVALEGYVITCADKIIYHDLADEHKRDVGSFIGDLPKLPELCVSDKLYLFGKSKIINRILVLPQYIMQKNQDASFYWDFVGDLGASRNMARFCCAKVGKECAFLAKDLRKSYHLPDRPLVFGEYNVVDHIEKTIKDYDNLNKIEQK